MAAVASEKESEPKRSYTQQTLKILFALSRNRCAAPGCTEPVIASPTDSSPALVVGQIAHIYAISEDGPRGRAGLTTRDANQVCNLILLCPTHHVKVDGQHASYPATMLLDWKTRRERDYAEAMSRSISDVGFAELEVAAKSLLVSRPHSGIPSLVTVPPQEKVEKNGLGPASVMLLSMGSAKSKEVADVLVQAAQLDPEFPERLSGGFIERYRKAKTAGLSGDEIFTELYDWAGGGGMDKAREAAGLCIVAHLFIICDIFEK
jgi:hypothetical protein